MKTTIALLFLLFVPLFILLAQPPGLPSAPSQAPIDGGLSLLAISGSLYFLKKLRAGTK